VKSNVRVKLVTKTCQNETESSGEVGHLDGWQQHGGRKFESKNSSQLRRTLISLMNRNQKKRRTESSWRPSTASSNANDSQTRPVNIERRVSASVAPLATGNTTTAAAASSTNNAPRVIPGFVYDAATNRYFRVNEARHLLPPPAVQARIQAEKKQATKASIPRVVAAHQSRPAQRKGLFAFTIERATQIRCSQPYQYLYRHMDFITTRTDEAFFSRTALTNHAAVVHAESGLMVTTGAPVGGIASKRIHRVDSAGTASECPVRIRRISAEMRVANQITQMQAHVVPNSNALALIQSNLGSSQSSGGVVIERYDIDTASNSILWSNQVPRSSVWSVATTSDLGSMQVAAGASRRALVWDVNRSRHPIAQIPTGKSDVFRVQFADGNRTLLLGSRDGRIRQWDLRAPSPHIVNADDSDDDDSANTESISARMPMLKCASAVTWFAHPGSSSACIEHQLVVACMQSRLQLWDRRWVRGPVMELQGHSNSHHMLGCAISSDGSHVLAAGDDGRIRAWSVAGAPSAKHSMQTAPLRNSDEDGPQLISTLTVVPDWISRRPCWLAGADHSTACVSFQST
jgi:hypothetical protein